MKLSASALNTFLRSPKMFYWRYIKRVEPIQLSVATFDHDKLAGILWSEFVDRFYKGVDESTNTKQTLDKWMEQTEGWVPDKARDRLTNALTSWATSYHQLFNKDDGTRNGSELHLENDRFVAYLDGLSHDKVVHEVKSTSRSPQLTGQLWKVENSIQVKLYSVMAKATGIRIEFAFKDPPHALYRAQVKPVIAEDLKAWEHELNQLADYIYSLGDDPNNYPCHPDGCCIVSKGMTAMCSYQTLCDMGITDETKYGYKEKTRRA